MKSNYKRLGNYIREVNIRNRDMDVTKLVGLSITKEFIPSVANIIGTDLSIYKVIRKEQFACSLMQVSRDEKIPIAMLEFDEAIMSPAYPMFEVVDKKELLPQYLMMWFSRSEFDREASFYAVGGVRGSLTWEDFCNMTLPIPPKEKQRDIVTEYEILTRRIVLNKQLCAKLEETAKAIYKKLFVDDIDVINLPNGWRMGTILDLGEVIGGATPSTTIVTYWSDDDGITWITPADLSKQKSKFMNMGSKKISEEGYQSTSTKMLPIGSVLFSSRAPIGLMGIVDRELCTNQGFKSIVPKNEIGTAYVYYCIQSNKEKIAGENTGSTFDEISGDKMKRYEVVIPDNDILEHFGSLIDPIFSQQKKIEQENIKLKEMTLLLLSRITIS